jgi:general secretion pathway protein K
MALLYALWATALFALLAHNAGDAAHTALVAARSAAAQAEAQALADGALALGLLAVLERDPGSILPGSRTLPLPSGQALLHIEDEGGKVDLNRAPPTMLSGLFRAAGAATPEALADAVIARRTGVEAARPGFALPESLGQVPGISPALARALAGSVTTVARAELVDPAVAPALPLQAIGLSSAQAAAFMATRGAQGRFARPPGVPAAAPVGALTGAGFTLRADAARGTAMARRVLVIRPLPFGERAGAALIDWHRDRQR